MGHLPIILDRNFDPPGVAHYLDFFGKSRKRLKRGVIYLDSSFGPAGVAHYSGPGHHRTLVHYERGEGWFVITCFPPSFDAR